MDGKVCIDIEKALYEYWNAFNIYQLVDWVLLHVHIRNSNGFSVMKKKRHHPE